MVTENLPLELLNKHRGNLGLKDPIVFEHENQLFDEIRRLDLRRNLDGNPISVFLPSAVVFLPKSKALINLTLSFVSGIVVEGGTIVLAGTNDAGIRSAKDLYEKNIGTVDQKIVGNHSALYIGKNARLGAAKKLEDFLSFSPVTYKDVSLEVANLPGVFSAGELDEGTKLLLDHIPYDKKKILDVGCGTGIIGAVYKKTASESEVVMSDSSVIAIRAAEETLKKNKIEAKVVLSDIFSNVEGEFDLIVTNPPFHKGIGTDYSFIERFAKDVKKHLNKNGEVYVVANSFLAYQNILEKNIGSTEVVIDTKKFRIYKSRV